MQRRSARRSRTVDVTLRLSRTRSPKGAQPWSSRRKASSRRERFDQGMTYDDVRRDRSSATRSASRRTTPAPRSQPRTPPRCKELMAQARTARRSCWSSARTGARTSSAACPSSQRIAEATGIEMRVFPRDQHKDIIAEFLHDGEFESIPVAVFYTKDHDYIAHWIERPAKANERDATTSRRCTRACASPT